MGPAAWAAVGRALSIALLTTIFNGKDGLVAILARQIQRAISENELQLAEVLIRDMAIRHRKNFQEFMNKFKDDLPEQMFDEFAKLL